MDTVLATWISDGWLDAARIVGIGTAAYIAAMWVAAVVWTHRDIQSRTNDETMRIASVLTVALFSVPGILLYLALRPPHTLQDAHARRIEEEAFAQELRADATCPACRRAVRDDFQSCPFCREALASRCDRCDRHVQASWVMCPYCTAEREAPVAAPARPWRAPALEPAPTPQGMRAAPALRATASSRS